MRSILQKIIGSPAEGKRHPLILRLMVALIACTLVSCAGEGGGGPVRRTSRSFTTVIVDAGHGGHDVGTRASRRILEKDAALDVAQRLNAKLRAAGLKTVMTRSGDYFVGLDDRVAISNRQSNAIFVSVHFNEAKKKPSIHGTETYYHSAISTDLGRSILAKAGQIPGGAAHFMKSANYRVLRNNLNPAVLVECAYLSNPGDSARSATPEFRDQLASAIAAGIIEQRKR
jgi:N-acetylmuramoyl-L-alanine amidase